MTSFTNAANPAAGLLAMFGSMQMQGTGLFGAGIAGAGLSPDFQLMLGNMIQNGGVLKDMGQSGGNLLSGGQLNVGVPANVLQSLTPEQLKALVAQSGITNGLSVPADITAEVAGDGAAINFINDPKLAQMLLGQNNIVIDENAITQLEAMGVPAETIAMLKGSATQAPAPATDMVDANLEQFKDIKKNAYADIAPLITQPKKVAVDGQTVAELPQGPSFLDNSDDAATLAAIAGLMMPAAPVQQQTTAGLAAATGEAAANIAETAPALTGAAAPRAGTQKSAGHSGAAPLGAGSEMADAGAQATGKDAGFSFSAQKNDITTALNSAVARPTLSSHIQAAQTSMNAMQAAFADVSAGASAQMSLQNDGSDDFDAGLGEAGMSLFGGKSADPNAAPNLTNSMLQSKAASQPHPATQTVTVAMQKMAMGSNAIGGEQNMIIRLDPPMLGKIRVTMSFGEDKTVKAKIIAEKPETLALLQRDAATLERGLNDAGLDLSKSDSLTFDLSADGGFGQAMNDNGGNGEHGSGRHSHDNSQLGTDVAEVTSEINLTVDHLDGYPHVNLMV